MAPTTQERGHQGQEPDMETVPDEAVVISGVSGLMPECASFLELGDKLFMKQNLVAKHNRWRNFSHPELPEYYGLLQNVDKFDAQFFTVSYNLAHSSEPGSRKLFENTFQAIFDAGICPPELSSKKVGVFLACALCDSEKACSKLDVYYGLVGCGRAMFSNRISFWLNLKGPSFTLDGDACGSGVALEHACQSIMEGHCEAAIVGSAKILLHPQIPILYNRECPMNFDGKTKCYDANADGHSLSEAVNVMFLQKYKDAKRVYAVVRHAKAEFRVSNEEMTSEYLKVPRDAQVLTNFYKKFYEEAGVSPSSVEYVEGIGAANPETDKMELQALEQVFCKDRQRPLLVGSIASNMGYSEASASSCGIFKMLLAYQRGMIPATINCSNPRQDIAALRDGRMCIATEHVPLLGSFTAVNGFSLTGLNSHVLLEKFRKKKDLARYHTNMPYLVLASGRQETSVQMILDDVMSRQPDPEEIALLHNIFKNCIGQHLIRGYGVYSGTNEKINTHSKKMDYCEGEKRPLWFVYSGMGSQWAGMGKQLMRIPLFAKSIQKSHKILEPKGLDLIKIITTEDEAIFDNILHSFVGIAAIQIALTDILKAVGLVPDNIIGHSVGELGCAYADGCFSAEQVLQLAYLRGYLSLTTPMVQGAMAAIGLGHKQISNLCPPEIDVACHNSATSSTISGPAEVVRAFIEKLTKDGIFAKEVNCSNIAYHSRYIATLGANFIKNSRKIVKTPKLRSDRWLSSSVPHDKWTEPEALYSSAEYHTNNLLSTVLFEETLRFVPSNAVLVEIAPHGLLQAILKRALSVDCQHVPLTRRGHQDSTVYLLEAIGNLYIHGYEPDVSALYPKVEFPVSTATRPLSHLVEWVHTEEWKMCGFDQPESEWYHAEHNLTISLEDDDYQYLSGHRIEGVCVYPFAACLVAAWDLLCMTLNQEAKKVSVQFLNLKFYSQLTLLEHHLQYVTVTLQRGSGHFEVFDGKVVLVEGTINAIAKVVVSESVLPETVTMQLNKDDIYKVFYERGHHYSDQFRCIHSTNTSMTEAKIQWTDNWVTFIDGLIQMNALRQKHQGVSQLSYISRLTIDFKQNLSDRVYFDDLLCAKHDLTQGRTMCSGVIIEQIIFKDKPLPKRQEVVLKTLTFVPFYQNDNMDLTKAMTILMQMISEHKSKDEITIAFVNAPNKLDYAKKIEKVVNNLSQLKMNITSVKLQDILVWKPLEKTPDAVFLHDLLSDKKIFEALYQILVPETLVISIGADTKAYPLSIYKPVSVIGSGKTNVELTRFRPAPVPSKTTAISVRSLSDVDQYRVKCEELTPNHRLLVLAPYPTPVGLKDQVNVWRKQNRNVSMVMFDQRNVMDKELENIPDMPFSLLHNGVWGSEYYLPVSDSVPTKNTVALRCSLPGDLNSLSWVEVSEPVEKRGVDVTVHYAGLTAMDASKALAETPEGLVKEGFGMDFSGVTARGERVMGLLPRGAASNKVRVDPNMLWPVPSHWTLEDAATVPYAYAHAMYCLYIKIWLMPGMNVFIYGGAGALGQAAISIALAHGCQVFTTVNDVRKKRFLKKLFPQLKDQHIGNSRDDAFQFVVKNATKGEGCDIFLSCAKGNLKKRYFSCIALNGNIIDTAQLVSRENIEFEYRFLARQVSYHAVDFSSIFDEGKTLEIKKLQIMLSEGIIRGYVRPLSRVTYEPNETPRAFRLLTASRHRGRVLLSLKEKTLEVEPRISCHPSSSYVVVYNDEMLGLRVAELLAERGATNLFIHGEQTSYLHYKIETWKKRGVRVKVSSANLVIKEEAMEFLKYSNSVGGIDGIYVVSSNLRNNQKAVASILSNLDSVSRKLCPNLRHFALLSENDKSWREILSKRSHDGYPALSLQMHLKKYIDSEEVNNQTPSSDSSLALHSAIRAIEKALYSKDTIVQAFAQKIVPRNILEEVAKIPGVNITNATVDRTSLEQVGVDQGRAQELCNLLDDKFQITISPADVPQMTIGQLKQLKVEAEDLEQDVPGFGAYLNVFDEKALEATANIIVLPTLVQRDECKLEDFHANFEYLCIVPGLEGHHGRFRSLCERLKISAAVLQPGNQYPHETVTETAQRMAKVIMQYMKPKKGYNILGYEYGVLVALKIAAILESYGYTGTLYMVGGTPEDIRTSFNEQWKDYDDNAMQNELLRHMHTLITQTTSPDLEGILQKAKTWSEKVDSLIADLKNKVPHSIQYMRSTIEVIYSRIKQLQNYSIQPQKLKSKVVLLQAKPYRSSLESLKPYSHQEPSLINLQAKLHLAHKDLSCSNIINRYLHPEILEEYEKSNHCVKLYVTVEEKLKMIGVKITSNES